MTSAVVRQGAERHLLEVSGLVKHFPIRAGLLGQAAGRVRAVDGVDLAVNKGESFGIVGESGSGKTTLVKCILRLIEPTAGAVVLDGEDVGKLHGAAMRRFRSRAQMVFQDPYSSLNPRFTVQRTVGEPLVIHGVARGRALRERVLELLDLVGLKPDHIHRYPHEFSGGQRQRIGIARALALQPDLLVLDEPTSALDVSMQAQILNLLNRLQQRLGLTFLMISHDLTVVRHMCDRIAVMYRGRVVEQGSAAEVFDRPLHPYTRVLLASVPTVDADSVSREQDQADALAAMAEGDDLPLIEVSREHWARVPA